MRRPSRRAVSRTASIAAPVGGLNARDAIAGMPETDAVVMDNWFPDVAGVSLRAGSADWSTGYPAPVETLMGYKSGATSKLFAAAGTAIYDATNGGTVGAAVVSGVTNARWQRTLFGTPGGMFLMAVNGADSLRRYDGTTWLALNGASTPAITGVATSLLIQVNVFKQRLWFVEKDSMRVWYLPVDSVSGALVSIDFGSRFKLGGTMLFMTTITINNSYGIDDYAAFITSEGEVAVYKGIDPANAATWSLVGIFRIGRPIGVRSYFKLAGDVIMITADGFVSLEKTALLDRNEKQTAISDKIVNAATADTSTYRANFGWEGIVHPLNNKLIFNVPTSTTTSYQYVMNQINNSWCRFLGWNANCFELLNDVLYYGGATAVVKADTGTNDNGAAIIADCLPAYSYFRVRGQKRFTMCRPILSCTIQPVANLELYTDFNTTPVGNSILLFQDSSGPRWGATLWNRVLWRPGTPRQYADWYSLSGTGFAASLRFRVEAKNVTLAWSSTDVVYEPGGVL